MIQKTRTIYSTLSDGNMRVFGAENEAEIIKNQMNLGARIGVSDIARIRTTYDDRMDFTRYYEIADKNLDDFEVTKTGNYPCFRWIIHNTKGGWPTSSNCGLPRYSGL